MSECVDGGVRVPSVHSDERQGERGTFSSVTSIDSVKSMGVLMRSCCSCGDQSPAAVDLSLQARYRQAGEPDAVSLRQRRLLSLRTAALSACAAMIALVALDYPVGITVMVCAALVGGAWLIWCVARL